MITVYPSEQRGESHRSWLNSRHSFSFGEFRDPQRNGFSVLRVINEDIISPEGGFAPHSHRDMEIISYVLSGRIQHRDSEGNTQVLPAGEIQLMTAGSGIQHSEYNASSSEPVHFLQIWIEPAVNGLTPGYQQTRITDQKGLTELVTPDGRNGSLTIHQDAVLHRLDLDAGESCRIPATGQRRSWLQLTSGELSSADLEVHPGDGVAFSAEPEMRLTAGAQGAHGLLFDLP